MNCRFSQGRTAWSRATDLKYVRAEFYLRACCGAIQLRWRAGSRQFTPISGGWRCLVAFPTLAESKRHIQADRLNGEFKFGLLDRLSNSIETTMPTGRSGNQILAFYGVCKSDLRPVLSNFNFTTLSLLRRRGGRCSTMPPGPSRVLTRVRS